MSLRARIVRAGLAWASVLTLVLAVVPSHAAEDYFLIGRDAPDFALHAIAARNLRLSEHRGEVVVLSFWGSRCGPCAAQLASLDSSARTYGPAGLLVLGINVDDDQNGAREFADAQKLSFPLLLDPRKSVGRLYRVDNLPMLVVIDRDGKVRYVHRTFGRAAESTYVEQLRALLNE